jgi:hypothetical protein
MGRSVAQRLAAVRAARSRTDEFMSGAGLDAQVALLVAAVGVPERPSQARWVTEDGITMLLPGEPLPAVPPTNDCPACQAWGEHLLAAFTVAGVGPLRGVPAQPPCWGTHEEVA